MTNGGMTGMTSSDLWKWALAGLVSVMLAGATIAINQWAGAQTATNARIEAKQSQLEAKVSGMAEADAAFRAEVRVRLDRIEDGLGVGATEGVTTTGDSGLILTDGPVAGMATLEGTIGLDAP